MVALLSPPAAPDGGGRPPPVEDSAAPVEGVEGAAPPADGAEGEGASPAPPVADTESHDNVGQLLVEIIRNSRWDPDTPPGILVKFMDIWLSTNQMKYSPSFYVPPSIVPLNTSSLRQT